MALSEAEANREWHAELTRAEHSGVALPASTSTAACASAADPHQAALQLGGTSPAPPPYAHAMPPVASHQPCVTSFVPPRRSAPPPPPTPAPPAERARSSPYNPYRAFCREQRPHLPPALLNRERELILGQMWEGLSRTEKARFGIGTTPAPALAPAPSSLPSFGDLPPLPPTAPPAVPAAPLAALASSLPTTQMQLQLAQSLENMTEDEAVAIAAGLP